MTFKPRMTLAQATQCICAIGIAALLAIFALMLHGCATTPDDPCGYMAVATTQDRQIAYVRLYCVKEV